MKNTVIFCFVYLFGALSFAGPTCTKEEKSKWMDQKKFQEDLKKQGYKIKVFKVTKGNCYEIYGWDKNSNKVEIYYHPITAKVMKKRSY